MIVSDNEIQVLVCKAGEARGLEPGLREDLAEACAWLARHQLPGLELAAAVLQEDCSVRPRPLAEPGHWNLAGGSLLLWLRPLLEHHLALNGQAVELILENARDPLAMLPVLLTAGPALRADWQAAAGDADDQVRGPRQELRGRFREPTQTIGRLRIRFELPGSTIAPWLDADALTQRRAHSLDHGIEVPESTWKTLRAMARNILVEASEASRQRGAGEIT
ncbi:MAG: DUF3726 domain-containing protein [Candidatus Competibacterales bacterium]|nr:DUF3726 domain-containing protein [Candidatus Competibacterales bacterium]